eukprot:TRINITY_DN561_c0_g1_i4.p1 TRINITY_DN561_c0_g1~~TRINITY_DN561_c0_g1_i4.p1  ORF type:complete len:469 (-),score=134.44 TRINITY_DN561_c0_g1_i4:405-1811(-)
MTQHRPELAFFFVYVCSFVIFVGQVEFSTANDFSIAYKGNQFFTVSSLNNSCICNSYSSTGSSFLQTLSTTSFTVAGGAVVSGGLTVGGGGVTVANGQTVNVGTSLSATPLNVWGPATFRNSLTVSNGAVSVGTSGTGTPLTVYGPVVANAFTGNLSAGTGLSAQPEFAALAAKVDTIKAGGSTGAACLQSTDCQSPRVCHRGSCKMPLGSACTSDQQCMTDVHGCSSSVCDFYRSCSAMRGSNPGAVSGYYPIVLTGGRRIDMWCNFETAGEGWTVVWSNMRGGTGKPMTGMSWASATTGVFRFKSGSATTAIPQVSNPEDWLVFTGLSFWTGLSPRGRLRYDWSPDYAQPIAQSYECDYTLTTANYVITFTNCVARVGSVVPGLVGVHNGKPFTTVDNKNDVNPTNCAALYSGSPWWYTSCWNGNINGGGENNGEGYYNGAYWGGAIAQWGAANGVGAGNGWILVS